MKRIGIVACLALSLCGTPQNARAHGCELLWAIPLALGVGAAIGSAFSPHPTYVYPPPAYVYSPPVYVYNYTPPAHASGQVTYNYPQTQPLVAQHTYPAAAAQTAQANAAAPTQSVVWTPRTIGTGHWVPDSQPYVYLPQNGPTTTTVASRVNAQGVSVSSSPGSIPVYVVSR